MTLAVFRVVGRGNGAGVIAWVAVLSFSASVARAQDGGVLVEQQSVPTRAFPTVAPPDRQPSPQASQPPRALDPAPPATSAHQQLENQPRSSPILYRAPATTDRGAVAPAVPRWYGWQTLALDSAAVGLLALSTSGDAPDGNPVAWGTALYVVGGPSVHLAHRRGSESLASLSLRILVPLPVMLIVGGFTQCTNEVCGYRAARTGFLMGAATAGVLDAALLAHDDPRPAPERQPRARKHHGGVSPALELTPEQRALVIYGRF